MIPSRNRVTEIRKVTISLLAKHRNPAAGLVPPSKPLCLPPTLFYHVNPKVHHTDSTAETVEDHLERHSALLGYWVEWPVLISGLP
jgi:hypothetical protein